MSARSTATRHRRQPGLGEPFSASIVEAVELAAENPFMGSALPPPAADVRKFAVKRFPFAILGMSQ